MGKTHWGPPANNFDQASKEELYQLKSNIRELHRHAVLTNQDNDLGDNKIQSSSQPENDNDLTNKGYVDQSIETKFQNVVGFINSVSDKVDGVAASQEEELKKMDEKFVATLRRSTEAQTLANEAKETAALLNTDFQNVRDSNAALTTQVNDLSTQVFGLISPSNQNILESSFRVLQFSNDSSLVEGEFNFFRPGNYSYIPYEITITCVRLFFGRNTANKDYSVELALEVAGREISSFPIELKTLQTFDGTDNRMLSTEAIWFQTIVLERQTRLKIRTKKFRVTDSLYLETPNLPQNDGYYCTIYLYY